MGSPLLVTDNSVEAINRALNDISRQFPSSSGASSASIKAVSAAYTFTDSDGVTDLFVTTGVTNVTVTLARSATNKGRLVRIWKADSGAGEVVVVGNTTGSTTDLIDGYTAVYAGFRYQHCDIYQGGLTNFNVGQYIQVVPGEPSLGTPRIHYARLLNNYNPGATPTNLTLDISAQVPVGTKMIYGGFIQGYSPTLGRTAGAVDASGNFWIKQIMNVANRDDAKAGLVPVDSSRQIRFYWDNADWDGVYFDMFTYWV